CPATASRGALLALHARSACQVGAGTRLVMGRTPLGCSTSSHIARDTSACSSETAFARRDSRSTATVMLNGSPPIWRISQSTSSQHAPSRRSSASACTSLPAAPGLCVVNTNRPRTAAPGRAHRGPGLDERRARGHALRDQLDTRERRVAVVEVIGVDVDAELAQRAHAADAEENLLRHAAVERGVVEAVRDPRVARGDGLQQEEGRVPPSLGAPHARLELAGGDPDAYPHPRVLGAIGPRPPGPPAPP